MPFRFKYFEVEDEQSTLKVSTDAMLLGSWAEPGNAQNILDIGTGCGVLALMMAQKSSALIDAIDIDEPSIEQACTNFKRSTWKERLHAHHCSLQEFSRNCVAPYDFIITNPPFFSHALKSPVERKNKTRHETEMSHPALVESVAKILKPEGFFFLILPFNMGQTMQNEMEKSGLFLCHSLMVSSIEDRPPKRILLSFSPKKVTSVRSEGMFILNRKGAFSEFYLNMTRKFHQF